MIEVVQAFDRARLVETVRAGQAAADSLRRCLLATQNLSRCRSPNWYRGALTPRYTGQAVGAVSKCDRKHS
jgi:hypothetical protein